MSVVNWLTTPGSAYDVYIGRHVPNGPPNVNPEACIYGNPFVLHDVNDDAEREKVIADYERWLLQPAQRELVARAKRELPGKVLACWCKPRKCHGDVLLRVAGESEEETERRRGFLEGGVS